MNRVAAIVVVTAVLLVALKLFVWYLEPKLVFFPFPGVQATPRTLGLDFRDLQIHTADGERLAAWWIEPPDARVDVVYFHGNGGNLSNWLPILAEIAARGCAVLALDYRGYGASSGTPSERGLYHDADAALALFWRDLHVPSRAVVYWGRSLGGAPATYAASVRAPDGLILESPFPDKAAAIADSPVLRVLNLFATYRLPIGQLLRTYTRPALIVLGDADTIVGPELSRQVYDGLTGPKSLVVIAGGGHNDLHLVDPARYWQHIESFVASLGSSELRIPD